MGMEDGLPENAMFPEGDGRIIACKEVLYLLLKGQEICIQSCGNISITGIVMNGNDKRMARHKWGMIGKNTKGWCLFEYIMSDAATLTECATILEGTGI